MISWLEMLSCRDAVTRLHRAHDESGGGIPWTCRVHLGICRHCRRYSRQLNLMRRALRLLEAQLEHDPGESLPAEIKEQLCRRLTAEQIGD